MESGPVKARQRTSGGFWRTLQGLTFAVAQSHVPTGAQCAINALEALPSFPPQAPAHPSAIRPGSIATGDSRRT
jgi:hypothetical protein